MSKKVGEVFVRILLNRNEIENDLNQIERNTNAVQKIYDRFARSVSRNLSRTFQSIGRLGVWAGRVIANSFQRMGQSIGRVARSATNSLTNALRNIGGFGVRLGQQFSFRNINRNARATSRFLVRTLSGAFRAVGLAARGMSAIASASLQAIRIPAMIAANSVRSVARAFLFLGTIIRFVSAQLRNVGREWLEIGQELTMGLGGPFLALGGAAIWAASQTEKGKRKIEGLIDGFKDALMHLEPMGQLLLDFAIEILPAVASALKAINKWFTSLSDTGQKWIIWLSIAAVVLGPLIMVLGAFAYVLGGIGAIIGGLLSKAGAIVAIIALFIYGLIEAYNRSKWFRDAVSRDWALLKQIFATTWAQIKETFASALDSLTSFWEKYADQVNKILQVSYEIFRMIITQSILQAIMMVQAATLLMVRFWEKHGHRIQSIIANTYEMALAIVTAFVGAMRQIWNQYGEDLLSRSMMLSERFIQIFEIAFQTITTIFSTNLGRIALFWAEFGEKVIIQVFMLFQQIREIVEPILLYYADFISWILDTILLAWENHGQSVLDTVLGALLWLWEGIIYPILSEILAFIGGIVTKITDFWQENGTKLATITSETWTAIATIISWFVTIVAPILSWLWENFLVPLVQWAWSIITSVIDGAITLILDILQVFINLFVGDWEGLWKSLIILTTNLLKNVVNIIDSIFIGLARKSWKWGKNMLSQFISGIKSMFGELRKTVLSVAQTISNFLGFSSPTKKGPGRKSDEWIPNLIDMFATGLDRGIPKIRMSALKIANNLSLVGAPSSPVNNTTYNFNITAQQANLTEEGIMRYLKRSEWLYG